MRDKVQQLSNILEMDLIGMNDSRVVNYKITCDKTNSAIDGIHFEQDERTR